MEKKINIGIFVDSFYPVVDGVSQVVNNYCKYLNKYDDVNVTLVTPRYPTAEYDKYEYNIYPYMSFGSNKKVSYRVGWPYVHKVQRDVKNMNFDIIHLHAPLASSKLVELVNKDKKSKVVLTYHTKYDVDFEARLKFKPLKKVAYSFLDKNVNATDEVWIVSKGSEESLRRVGFRGECRVMENGVDFIKGAAEKTKCDELRKKLRLPEGTLVFSFIGRMQWYKNIKLILDALALVNKKGLDYRFLMVGDGFDRAAMEKYAAELGIADKVIFTGSVNDRDELRVYYSITDLFLFLSTFDTAAIVVKEAAACDTPTLFAAGSDSAYGVSDSYNGWFAEETPGKTAEKILSICSDRENIIKVGKNAADTLYVPWSISVDKAYHRYKQLLGLEKEEDSVNV